MNILITGANGQLGSEIKEIAFSYTKFSFLYEDLPSLDICNFLELDQYVKERNINAIINCAAYTAVDKAESDFETAEKVNALGIENIVKVMQILNGKVIQISTDYVFDGTNYKPYTEEDKVNPLGVYGSTKLNGEHKILNADINELTAPYRCNRNMTSKGVYRIFSRYKISFIFRFKNLYRFLYYSA